MMPRWLACGPQARLPADGGPVAVEGYTWASSRTEAAAHSSRSRCSMRHAGPTGGCRSLHKRVRLCMSSHAVEPAQSGTCCSCVVAALPDTAAIVFGHFVTTPGWARSEPVGQLRFGEPVLKG